jgi:hypothetical protein
MINKIKHINSAFWKSGLLITVPWGSLFKRRITNSSELARLWRNSRTPPIPQILVRRTGSKGQRHDEEALNNTLSRDYADCRPKGFHPQFHRPFYEIKDPHAGADRSVPLMAFVRLSKSMYS